MEGKTWVLLTLLVIVLVSGCVTGQSLEFETLSKGAYSGHPKAGEYVINNAEEWEQLWNRTMSNMVIIPDVPGIDFSQSTVLALFLGERNTGGYGIEITEILEQEEMAVVKFRKTSPPPGSFVTQALTQPYHIVKAPKLTGEVAFEEV